MNEFTFIDTFGKKVNELSRDCNCKDYLSKKIVNLEARKLFFLKHLNFYLLVTLLHASFCGAQDISVDSILQTEEKFNSFSHLPIEQAIDSLEKFVVEQYYEKNYDQTIEIGTKLTAMAEAENDALTVIRISSFIGNAFLQSEDTLTSRKMFMENVKRAMRLKNPSRITTTQIDLANFYALTKNSKKAIELYSGTLPYAIANKDTTSLYILHSNIAELSLENEDIEAATFHVGQMNNYVQKSSTDYFVAGAKLLNGRLQLLLNNTDKAVDNLKEGIRLAESINFDDILIHGYDYLSKAEAKRGNYKEALAAAENHQKYLGERYERDKITAIETVTAKYRLNDYKRKIEEQTLKNEIDRQQAKRDTTILWAKIASGIFLIFSIFMIWANLNRKKLLKDLQAKNRQYLIAKEESEELSKAKSILFSNITHELRTPMYGIIGITSLLLNDKRFNEQKENLSSLKFSADYLLSLINNVLYFNKTEARQNDVLKKTTFSIRELVTNIVESAKFLNTSYPNEILIDIDNSIPELLRGDDTKLSQILMNLLSNASKFTENGTISVILRKVPTQQNEKIRIAFKVKDNGIGISATKRTAILEYLSQDRVRAESANGSGIGLPIVKRILDQHNSHLQLDSEIGKGTEVSFEIDYETVSSQSENLEKNTDLPIDSLSDTRILIVDDNKINQMVTKKSVEKYGAFAMVAGSGEEALQLIAENTFDLILMDINMPGMDGFETTERIRMTDKQIPIIALTAVEKEKVVHQERFGLMNDIVIKPYQGAQFITTLTKNLLRQ